MNHADELIKTLKLAPHPEGGYFKEIYRSAEQIPRIGLPTRYTSARSAATSIYFLLKSHQVSKFHRLNSDEIWHLYEGSSVTLHLLFPDGTHEVRHLYPHATPPEYQVVIPHGVWFGATVDETNSYALMGCSVSPGFDFEDFELADRETLLKQYPGQTEIITQLT